MPYTCSFTSQWTCCARLLCITIMTCLQCTLAQQSVCMLQLVCFFCYAATRLHEVQILLETTSWQNRFLQTTLVGLFQYMGVCMLLQVGAGQGTGGRGGLGSRGGRQQHPWQGNGRGRGQGTARSAGLNPFTIMITCQILRL